MDSRMLIQEGLDELKEVVRWDDLWDYGSPLDDSVYALRANGVEVPTGWWDRGNPIVVAEAVNWAAKTITPGFYDLKGGVVDQVSRMPGVVSGWGEDGTFTLFHGDVGAASFHDPHEEISSGGEWPHPWSGVRRQDLAFQLLVDKDLLEKAARATTPEALA